MNLPNPDGGDCKVALDRVREIVSAARPGTRIPPIDCTNHCGDGPCDCSGEWRVMSWAIDIPGLRAIFEEADRG